MLKYLFTAEFEDGTKIVQDQGDRSLIEPDKRSRFFDVLQKEKESKLVRFSLTEFAFRDASTYSVDLRDGHFEKDGVTIKENPKVGFEAIGGFRIVFWRAHTHTFKQGSVDGATAGERPNPGIIEQNHSVAYKIGWQATVNGKNVEEIIEID